MTNDENKFLMEFLTLQNARLNFHGDKLWEEMKHFSAVLYILLGAPFIISDDFKSIAFIFPLLAICVAFIALVIIHKEGKDFIDALGTVLSIEKRLEFHKECATEDPIKIVSNHRINKLGDKSIEEFIENESCKFYTTRWWFQFYFIGLIIVGIMEVLFLGYTVIARILC